MDACTKKDLVSIIIPVYNAERFLSRCLDSVCNQTYSHLEILLIDDGSTDNSLAVCKAYEQQDARIRVFSKINEGQGKARNLGLDLANGDYVLFVDSDDYIHLQTVELLLKVALEKQADMVQCLYREVMDGSIINNDYPLDFEKLSVQMEKPAQQRLLCYYTEDIVPVNKLFRKDLIADKRFPEGMVYEDKHLMFRLRYYAKTIARVDEVLYFYVQTNNSTMRSPLDKRKIESHFRIMDELADFCLQNELIDNYKSEQSGNFRTLLHLFFQTYKLPEYEDYNRRAYTTIKNMIPKLKENEYVRGKDQVLLRILSVNPRLITILYYFNSFRKQILKR